MKNVILLQSNEDMAKHLTNCMLTENPIFFGRIGGSDTNIVKAYYERGEDIFLNNRGLYDLYLNIVKSYNGYFDFSTNLFEQTRNFKKYLDMMIVFYKCSDDCSWTQIEGYIKNNELRFLEYVLEGKTLISYGFIEHINLFLKTFSIWAKGKKILIVSPFSKSIQYQWQRKDTLFLEYRFPEFELSTYNTSITYNIEGDQKDKLQIQTNNWHEECKRMTDEISKLDFDIALLSCASYGMYLGNYIKNAMQKKALYLGGVLNMIFNIYGGRFGSYSHLYGLNMEAEIDPIENDDIVNIRGGRGTRSEGIQAYFGRREKI